MVDSLGANIRRNFSKQWTKSSNASCYDSSAGFGRCPDCCLDSCRYGPISIRGKSWTWEVLTTQSLGTKSQPLKIYHPHNTGDTSRST